MYARAYISRDVGGHGPAIGDYLDGLDTDSKGFLVPIVSTTDACTPARQVLVHVGMRPLDAVDAVTLASCAISLSRSLE